MSLTIVLILCNLTTFILTILTIIHTVRLRRLRSIRWLIALSVTFLIGSFCLVNVYITPTFEEKVLFLQLRVWGMAFLTPCWLYFISSVFDLWNWLHKKWVMMVMFFPSFLNLLLIAYPGTRELLFTNFAPISFMGVSSARFDFGSWYSTFYMWAMLQMLASYIISIQAFLKTKGHRRRQVVILNVGLTISLLQSVVAHLLSKALEIEFIVTNTFPLVGTSIGIMYALIYHRLLSIVPLAMVKIFKQLPDPVFVMDDEMRVMGVSERGIQFFGLKEDYIGQTFEKLVPSVSLTAGEVVLYSADKARHHFHIVLEKIEEKEDTSSGTVVSFRDISPQKLVELQLMEGMDTRTRLLALMAHDLSGFVDTQAMIAQTLQKNIGAQHSQHLDHLESLSMASQSLISNVMIWTQNESIKFDIVKKSFEWNSLILEVLEQVRGRLVIKEIEVDFVHSGVIISTGDSEMMSSVFRNILFNSIRASSRGKKIMITLSKLDSSVEVKVHDEGQGIAPEELERILETSKDFSLTGVSQSHGSGLGLMLARYFISLHSGSFSMDSKLGVGTVVGFSVPL